MLYPNDEPSIDDIARVISEDVDYPLLIEDLRDHLIKHYGGHISPDQIEKAAVHPQHATKLAYGLYKGVINDVDESGAIDKVAALKPIAPEKEERQARGAMPGVPHIVQILLSKDSKWPGKKSEDPVGDATAYIDFNSRFDPTSNKQYLPYLVKQVAKGTIRLPEDGGPFSETIETFISKDRDWPGKQDIFQYGSWRELQAETMEYASKRGSDVGSTRSQMMQYKKSVREGTNKIISTDIMTTSRLKNYEVYELTNWAAVTLHGKGTQWCTSSTMHRTRDARGRLEKGRGNAESLRQSVEDAAAAMADKGAAELNGTPWQDWGERDFVAEIYRLNGWPTNQSLDEIKAKSYKSPNPHFLHAKSTAESYLQDMPLYVIYKDGEPYIQVGGSSYGIEMKNPEDKELTMFSPALIRVMSRALDTGKLDRQFVEVLEPRLERDLERYKKVLEKKKAAV